MSATSIEKEKITDDQLSCKTLETQQGRRQENKKTA